MQLFKRIFSSIVANRSNQAEIEDIAVQEAKHCARLSQFLWKAYIGATFSIAERILPAYKVTLQVLGFKLAHYTEKNPKPLIDLVAAAQAAFAYYKPAFDDIKMEFSLLVEKVVAATEEPEIKELIREMEVRIDQLNGLNPAAQGSEQSGTEQIDQLNGLNPAAQGSEQSGTEQK